MFQLTFRLGRTFGPRQLAVKIAGVRLGERVIQVGVGDPRVFSQVAAQAGLTGRACAVVDTPQAAAILENAAADQGVLVEVAVAQAGAWPFDNGSFDIAIVDANTLLAASATDLNNRLQDVLRVVRPGGRVLAILRRSRGILTRLGFERFHQGPTPEATTLIAAWTAAGCRPVRMLAEREGLAFVEGFRTGVI